MKVYTARHKLIEKYDVASSHGIGGGGEYPLQDGFGWTNGVLAALLAEDEL
uniref:Trehalase n=1 Tax=uncultured Spirosoma sp. TaxID=278208 RepID=A0A060C1I4_9BACT|nr:trehalase [uncultured Spirosoma sp.]